MELHFGIEAKAKQFVAVHDLSELQTILEKGVLKEEKQNIISWNNTIRVLLNKTNLELYECFDAAYKADKETFTNPQSLYTYFSLMVDLYDAGEKPSKDLFNKYDDIVEKVEDEVKNYSLSLNEIIYFNMVNIK